MAQPYDQPFAGMDAHFGAVNFPSTNIGGTSSMSHWDPSDLSPYSSTALNNTTTYPSNPATISDEFAMQQPLSTSDLSQPPLETELQVVPYAQPSNPTNPVIASPLQPELPGYNEMAATSKRSRLPKSAKMQHRSAFRQQVTKTQGVPGSFLDVFCAGPAPKNGRTFAQKQNKKAVEADGGACYLCRIKKKQVLILRLLRKYS